jgi:hypothetical protein
MKPLEDVESHSAAPIKVAPAKAGSSNAAALEAPAANEPQVSPRGEAFRSKKEAKPRNWLMRLLLGDSGPADARRAPRETLPGLITYFFNGGTPVAEEVRDISKIGMFVVTIERWYPGTVVRFTLTDQQNPSANRSIVLNAKSVRWGQDGVGLEFVLEGKERKGESSESYERIVGVDTAQVEDFLRRLKAESEQD